jgi:hypothetical protein
MYEEQTIFIYYIIIFLTFTKVVSEKRCKFPGCLQINILKKPHNFNVTICLDLNQSVNIIFVLLKVLMLLNKYRSCCQYLFYYLLPRVIGKTMTIQNSFAVMNSILNDLHIVIVSLYLDLSKPPLTLVGLLY